MSVRTGVALAQTLLKFEGGVPRLNIDGATGPQTQHAFSNASPNLVKSINKTVKTATGLDVKTLIGNTVPVNSSPNEDKFLRVLELVKVEGEKAGLIPRALVAQVIGESGHGKSGLSVRFNNYAGLKTNSMKGYPGKKFGSSSMDTSEFVNGKMIKINDGFATFDSPEHFVDAYIWYLTASSPARNLYAGLSDALSVEEHFKILKGGGYATDPDYVSTMLNISKNVPKHYPSVA